MNVQETLSDIEIPSIETLDDVEMQELGNQDNLDSDDVGTCLEQTAEESAPEELGVEISNLCLNSQIEELK